MKTVRKAEPRDYPKLFDLLAKHKKVGRQPKSDLDYEDFTIKITDRVVIFLCEQDKELLSYMISYNLTSFPIWVIRLLVTKPGDHFYNPEANGMGLIYDHAIQYWENKGFSSFIYLQPLSYVRSANNRLKESSKVLKTYTSYTMKIYPKGLKIEDYLIEQVADFEIYKHNIALRIHHKHDI